MPWISKAEWEKALEMADVLRRLADADGRWSPSSGDDEELNAATDAAVTVGLDLIHGEIKFERS